MSGFMNDPLFVGLTRPTLIGGVSLPFFMVNMMITGCFYIYSTSVKVVFVAIGVHIVGVIICFKEPRLIELFINRASKCNKCPNKFYYGANSYDM
ncbi:MAG: VirB3 family type IV secretion system protein [Rickettsiaceae bacterium]|nr:VirB3 family type IV secretion system protein [Rickettsiaceae bacterium]